MVFQRKREREVRFLKRKWVTAALLGFIGAKEGFFSFLLESENFGRDNGGDGGEGE